MFTRKQSVRFFCRASLSLTKMFGLFFLRSNANQKANLTNLPNEPKKKVRDSGTIKSDKKV